MESVKLEKKYVKRKSYLDDLFEISKMKLEMSSPYGPIVFSQSDYDLFFIILKEKRRPSLKNLKV